MTVRISSRTSVNCLSTQSPRCSANTASVPQRNTPGTQAARTQPGFSDASSFESSASAPAVTQAVEQIDKLLNPAFDAKEDKKPENDAEVLFNSVKVDSQSNTNPASSRYKKAKAQVEANQALEQDLLSKLPRKEQERYKAVKEALVGPKGANNPVAALALQKLLFQNRVPGGQDLKGEGNVLEHLAGLAGEAPLHKDIHRKELLGQLVQELATPSAIAQGERGTCAPTALSIDLNIHHPAEYARLMMGLATPKGEVELVSGQKLQREKDTRFDNDGTSRALTQRLMAPALMEKSNGKDDYRDSHKDKSKRNAGATASELDALYDAVYGQDMQYTSGDTRKWREDTMKQIDSEVKSGQNVLAGIYFDKTGTKGGHKVLVTGTPRIDGKDYVQYINPWGKEERMERSEFQDRLKNINYDPNAPKQAKPTQPTRPGSTTGPVQPSTPTVPSSPVVSRPPNTAPDAIQTFIALFQSFIDQLRRMSPAA